MTSKFARRMSSTLRNVPVVVVGGGVGGFTAALGLHRLGIQSRLVMRDARLSEAGGAVYLTQGAMRVLDRLGLGSRVRCMGLSVTKHEIYNPSGKCLFEFDTSAYGSQVYVAPRPLLRQALLESLPPDTVSFATRFICLDRGDHDNVVTVHLRDMDRNSNEALNAECVIGADGCRSQVRKYLARPGVSRPAGVATFRATVWNQDLDMYPMHTFRDIWSEADGLGFRGRFGCIRVTQNEVYWWCACDSPSPCQSGSSILVSPILRPYKRKIVDRLSNFPFRAADLVSSTQESAINWTDVRRIELEFPWIDAGTKRVALIGDAVRQSDLPYCNLGSSLAIIDAYSLAHAIADNRFDGVIREGGSLFRYEHERREHTRDVYKSWRRLDSLGSANNRVSRFLMSHALASQFTQQATDTYMTRSLERKGEALLNDIGAP
jgi:2-polyprenyl-6-methoxyphenol hydroxylase-like FAD-dependent oxidoreductase